jgi:hypothetical protein
MNNRYFTMIIFLLLAAMISVVLTCSSDKDVTSDKGGNVNQTPVLAPIGPKTITAGQNLNFVVSATNADSSIPTVVAFQLPTGATFTAHGDGTATFDWTTDSSQVGNYDVLFVAVDYYSYADSETVTISVVLENHPPVLASIGSKSTDEGSNLSFEVTAADADGTHPALSTSALPGGATFTLNIDNTGDFSWTPSGTQSGLYYVTFYASDGLEIDSEIVAITVNDTGGVSGAIIADHTAADDFDNIPASVIRQVRADYYMYYAHTSHGRQVMVGLEMVSKDTLYAYNSTGNLPFRDVGDRDLGTLGDDAWVTTTRFELDYHSEYNVVMWSWCSGVSTNNEAGINTYLSDMDQLEYDYPNVTFIYMTGHLDGTGPTGNLHLRNEQIRDYCIAHNKILFDFADIESYDPDGTYYPDESDACAWCTTWCADLAHDCPTCAECPHSHCFNCYRKGKAFWWMMARISGWSGR